jgi:hypothetical protein
MSSLESMEKIFITSSFPLSVLMMALIVKYSKVLATSKPRERMIRR